MSGSDLSRYVVNPVTGCWDWTGYKDGNGRACLSGIHVARLVWEEYFGPIPEELHVLHKCDNSGCVNPAHLFLGTHLDNMKDATLKGRMGPRGEKHGNTHLTEEDIHCILESKEPGTVLAVRFDVSTTTIYNIRNRKVWNHVG